MKKTIIALMALASASMAADTTLSDAIYTSTDGASITTVTTGDNAISGDFALTMTLDANALKAIMGNTSAGTTRPTYFYVDVTLNGAYITLANALNNTGFVGMAQGNLNSYALDGTGDPSRFPLTDGNPSNVLETNNFASNVTGNLTSKLDTLTSAAITFSHYNKNSSSLYVTLNFSDGSTSEIYGTSNGLKWSNGDGIGTIESININDDYVKDTYLFRGTVNKDNAFALNAAALVPEPTTATLSLLALAGLAARRRRRK